MGEQQQLERIEPHLSQIKALLIVIANLCILGFYGLTRSRWDSIDGIMTDIWEFLLVIGITFTVVCLIAWLASPTRRAGRSDGSDRPSKSP